MRDSGLGVEGASYEDGLEDILASISNAASKIEDQQQQQQRAEERIIRLDCAGKKNASFDNEI